MTYKKIAILVLTVFLILNGYGQSIQTFYSAGFKVNCDCKLVVNSTFLQLASQQGVNNVLASYYCAENEDSYETSVVYNINIYDESDTYNSLEKSDYAQFESGYLEQYASNLKASDISYTYITYQGVDAIEYTFSQLGLPTKAIIFLKDKKSYLVQVGTRKSLATKFYSFKSSFELL